MLLTSCQAENTEPVSRAIAGYIGRRLQIPASYVDDIGWKERYRRLYSGEIDVGWICGLPYVQRACLAQPGIALLVAPIMQGVRYRQRPVYFSDVVVSSESQRQTFSDLEGARWAINEPGSQSGCGIVRHYLGTLGRDWSFFGRVVESGSHRQSLELVLTGHVDASAIDSTYLEWRLKRRPALMSQLKIIASLGPSPIPPWIISTQVSAEVRSAVKRLLLEMSSDPEGRMILDIGGINRFVAVTDEAYEPIRKMLSS
jgi:phosphonate transport system substrate-binding protein